MLGISLVVQKSALVNVLFELLEKVLCCRWPLGIAA